MVFYREIRENERSENVIGIGHRAFDQAIRQALHSPGALACVRGLKNPGVIFQIYDEVTEHSGTLQAFTVGVIVDIDPKQIRLLTDGELLDLLNEISSGSRSEPPDVTQSEIESAKSEATAYLQNRVKQLGLPFVAPRLRVHVILWPVSGKVR